MEQTQYNDVVTSRADEASLLKRAMELHRNGQPETARSICAEILNLSPEQPDALHLLGIMAHRQGRTREAAALLRRSVEANPSDLNTLKNLILMLKASDQMEMAAAYCTRALGLPSQNHGVFHGLGDLFFRQGYPEEAALCYQKALSIHPDSVAVWGNLGNALEHCNRHDEALSCYRSALSFDPANADIYYNMGIALTNMHQIDEAASHFEKALVLDPDHAEAMFNLGNAYKSQGSLEKAVKCYQSCLRQNENDVDALHNLGNAYYSGGQLPQAMDAYTQTLERQPDHVLALNNLACLLQEIGAAEQAYTMLARSIEIAPHDPGAYVNLGHLHKLRNETEKALEAYRMALTLSPDHHDALLNIGRLLKQEGAYEEGLRYLKAAAENSPCISESWWYYYLSLPILYRTESDIAVQRNRLSDGIDTLIRRVPLDTPEQCKKALAGIGTVTNFYLQYQGQNDKLLQKKYGCFVNRIMAANYPQWVMPLSMPKIQKDGKIRIGYLSSFMRSHTVGHFLMGWLETHDRERFEVHGYHIGVETDDMTRAFEEKFDRFHHLPGSIEAMARQIREDDLHILTFTDIGMFGPATQLAGLRLAPVQCKGWGHPVTTGLETIDYYLSADLMETTGAADHYSETLVLLPHLALSLGAPEIPENSKTREQFGLSADDVVYLNSQSLFKYLPQYDEIYPRIAAKVNNARFVFISNPNPVITRQFSQRLQAAFETRGLSMEKHCMFQPRLSPDDFITLNNVSNVLLDPISWSGGKTTLEGLACDLPVVTCPGDFMRGRHAYAMLKRMGLMETIAWDVVSYVDIASRLGNDMRFYEKVRSKVASRRHLLFNDEVCIRALEVFYRNVVEAQFQS